VDILGPLYYAVKPRANPIRFGHGRVQVPAAGNGLGIEIDPNELEPLAPSQR
jgi:hypothetical protein